MTTREETIVRIESENFRIGITGDIQIDTVFAYTNEGTKIVNDNGTLKVGDKVKVTFDFGD